MLDRTNPVADRTERQSVAGDGTRLPDDRGAAAAPRTHATEQTAKRSATDETTTSRAAPGRRAPRAASETGHARIEADAPQDKDAGDDQPADDDAADKRGLAPLVATAPPVIVLSTLTAPQPADIAAGDGAAATGTLPGIAGQPATPAVTIPSMTATSDTVAPDVATTANAAMAGAGRGNTGAPAGTNGAASGAATGTGGGVALPDTTAVGATLMPDTAPMPARHAFAEAIQRAIAGGADSDGHSATADAPTATAAGVAVSTPSPIMATAAHAAVDTRHAAWPEAMMNRIETLRDMANANDMSIRLVPDALGRIDVSLHRDGDTVQVQMKAAEAQTQRLLDDARPQLVQAAESRGLRLGLHESGGGAQWDGQAAAQQQRQQQQANRLPSAPPGAGTGTGAGATGLSDADGTMTTQRIA